MQVIPQQEKLTSNCSKGFQHTTVIHNVYKCTTHWSSINLTTGLKDFHLLFTLLGDIEQLYGGNSDAIV